ncbi:hypothetical protein GF312_12590 [Candidatus Poribacteria bacterium]|nr:hypothetical protein [Candidatus Poribacteria bacterium]
MLKLNEERIHLSYNQIATMLSCPYKYYLQYRENRKWDYIPSAVSFGSAIHDSISHFHRALMNGGVEDISKFTEIFSVGFRREVNDRNVLFRDDAEPDELMEKGKALINEYVSSFEHLSPGEVEMEFRLPLVDIPSGLLLPKDLVGRIDMVSHDDVVYEFKTSSSRLPESSADGNLQLILYGWAFRMLYGRMPEKLVLVNLVKTKKPGIQVLESVPDIRREQKLMKLIFRINEAIDRDSFYPNPRGTYGCGCCPYSLSCEYTI